MSLDVYLYPPEGTDPGPCRECGGSGKAPLDYLYSSNITHNLVKMADAAGIYQHLWRPEELKIRKAVDLIEPLRKGLAAMKADPEKFRAFNAPNGWGLYEHFVPWVEEYLRACEEHPEAEITVSR